MSQPRTWADEDAVEECRSAMAVLARSKKPGDRERLAAAKDLVNRGHHARALAVALNMPLIGTASRGRSLDGPAPDGRPDWLDALDPIITT
jgi:hypothetical protein